MVEGGLEEEGGAGEIGKILCWEDNRRLPRGGNNELWGHDNRLKEKKSEEKRKLFGGKLGELSVRSGEVW